MSNKGICPSCNPTVNLDELDDGDAYHESVELRSLDGIGEKAATNLERAGYDTVEEIASATDEELLDVSWVGETALLSLKQRAKTLDPQQRWADT
jgi:predicted flap endonuclease-1-like 5' DNA nuclease